MKTTAQPYAFAGLVLAALAIAAGPDQAHRLLTLDGLEGTSIIEIVVNG